MSHHTALVSIKSLADSAPMRIFMKLGQTISIGSSQLADYQISDVALDKIHMRVSFNGGRLFVETVSVDIQFRFLGKPCDRKCLADGDELLAGATEFHFSLFSSSATTTMTDDEISDATSDTVEDEEATDPVEISEPPNVTVESGGAGNESTLDVGLGKVDPQQLADSPDGDDQGCIQIKWKRQNAILNRYFFESIDEGAFARAFSIFPVRLVCQQSIAESELASRGLSVVFELGRLKVYGLSPDCGADVFASFFHSGVVLVSSVDDAVLKNHLLEFRSTFRSTTSIVTNLLFGSEDTTTKKMKVLDAVFIPSETTGWHAFSLLSAAEFEKRFGNGVFQVTR